MMITTSIIIAIKSQKKRGSKLKQDYFFDVINLLKLHIKNQRYNKAVITKGYCLRYLSDFLNTDRETSYKIYQEYIESYLNLTK